RGTHGALAEPLPTLPGVVADQGAEGRGADEASSGGIDTDAGERGLAGVAMNCPCQKNIGADRQPADDPAIPRMNTRAGNPRRPRTASISCWQQGEAEMLGVAVHRASLRCSLLRTGCWSRLLRSI